MGLRYLVICLLFVGLPLSQFRLAADELPVWAPIGPDGGAVQALAVSPALPHVVLAGVPLGHGIFRSTDRARSWQAATDAAGRSVLDLAISANGKAFYAATNRGLLRSTDGGALWPVLDASAGTTLVAAHPRKPAFVFAVQEGVLLRSTDGGITRTAVDGPVGTAAIAFAPAGQRIVMYAGADNGLWRSTDDGRTWSDMNRSFASPPHVASVAVDPADPRIIYIGLQEGRRVLLKSRDGGATWRASQSGLPAAGETLPTISEIAVDRTNPSTVYAVAGGELFRSLDGGRGWSRPPRPPGGFVRALETTGYGVLAGTVEGVLLSVDRGLTWQARNAGLAATSISGMTIDRQEPARLYVAGLPGGIFRTAHQGRPWLRLGGITSEPLAAQLFAADPGTVYALASGGIFKSTDGGRSWSRPLSSSCLGFSRFAFDPREPDHLFASAYVRLPCYPDICAFFRSLDGGETWECLGNFLSLLYGDALLGVDPFTSAVYAQVQTGDLLRSTDDGTTWAPLGDLFDNTSSFIASPLVEGTLWAGQGRLVLRSIDGGATWEFFPTGLPEGEAVVALAPDPVDPEILYAASRQNGVLKSTDAGETWSLAGLWPPGGVLLGLLVDPNDPDVLYAGTDGMGVLRLDQSGD